MPMKYSSTSFMYLFFALYIIEQLSNKGSSVPILLNPEKEDFSDEFSLNAHLVTKVGSWGMHCSCFYSKNTFMLELLQCWCAQMFYTQNF